MRFVCEKCRTKYSIADEKVRNKVLKIRCKKCQNIIVVREPAARTKSKSKPAATERKRDRLDDEFERAFDRLTDGDDPSKPPRQRKAAPAKTRRDPELDREFGEGLGEDEWFAILRGEQIGPMSLAELREAVAEGRVVHGTYVWHDGMDDWVRAARCPEVKDALPDRRAGPLGQAEAKTSAADAEDQEEKTRLISPEQTAAVAAAPQAADETEAAAKEEPEPRAEVVPLRGRDEAEAEAEAEAGAEAPAETAEDATAVPERRLDEGPGVPPPMPEDDDEIIIAPAITGRLVTLRAAVAMCVASFVVASIGTAVLMAVLNPPVEKKVVEAPKKKTSKRKKIVLTPELLALKSQLFGEDPARAGGHRGRRGRRRKAPGPATTKPAAAPDGTGASTSPAGLEAAFANTSTGVEDARRSRGIDGTSAAAALATTAAAAGDVGLGSMQRSAANVSSGMDLDGGRRAGAVLHEDDSGPLSDGLSGETIAARFQGRWIESCYNRALKRDPSMKGKMIVSFELANSGRARDFEITPSKFRGTFLAKCFEREVRKIRFPRFRGEPIPIEYPFILSAH